MTLKPADTLSLSVRLHLNDSLLCWFSSLECVSGCDNVTVHNLMLWTGVAECKHTFIPVYSPFKHIRLPHPQGERTRSQVFIEKEVSYAMSPWAYQSVTFFTTIHQRFTPHQPSRLHLLLAIICVCVSSVHELGSKHWPSQGPNRNTIRHRLNQWCHVKAWLICHLRQTLTTRHLVHFPLQQMCQ